MKLTMSLNDLFIAIFFFIISISLSLHTCYSQPQEAPSPSSTCNSIFLSYNHTNGYPIPPTNPANQSYRFESTVTILNNGLDDLKSWRLFVGFQHNELLVSATNAVLADGSSLPASVGNGTVLAGFPETDLKSAIETAGDWNQMGVQIKMVGTQFGVVFPDVPMPDTIYLANDGYNCPSPTKQGNNTMHLCCTEDANSRSNFTAEDEFAPRQDGDLIIMYDVIRTYESNYWAQVSISNHNPLGRLDSWKLSWDWMSDEFIYAMKGAYPHEVDISDCVFGRQGQYYTNMDFSLALSCKRRPTIIDLPPTRADDSILGRIPFCCRNGTILPPNMDPSKSTSAFQMQVFKMPPDLNRSEFIPPQNWKINGTLNPDYQCGPPVRVSPSKFPDSSGLPTESTAIASWQVVCNITQSKEEIPRCCVSFSAFFNDTAIPCNTCACGCNNNPSQTCSATEPALLVRPDTLLVPFENRTWEALDWAKLKHRTVPNPLPCGDNCGVSINWHLLSDYRGGWTARITLFNWGEINYADWFAAVQLDKAVPGLEGVYSFNGTTLPGSNNTIFLQGFTGLNYLTAETDAAKPRKHPRVPGKQQSVISFTTKRTPDINVAKGDAFPTKVIFNGEECVLPSILPISTGEKMRAATSFLGLVTLLVLLLLLML
ncbi:hypothetical protein JRO89_XS01G0364500 [Xanthoceras sorbifolium]|uniref:COBRA C-terminal domain-containing protein n=1 Tax=Xanthoceras sorbifolium TaxID=99658 RepID=A0ABQ8INV7_9ROSI|nr:hypothetical protein JRO89_XS01G0364500 [Xanthoceras sorbifolium]